MRDKDEQAPDCIWIPTYNTGKLFDDWHEDGGEDGDIMYMRADVVERERGALLAEMQRCGDWMEQYRRIIADAGADDEVHCTCVPGLRLELAEKDKEIERLRQIWIANSTNDDVKLKQIDALLLRCDQLNAWANTWRDACHRMADEKAERAAEIARLELIIADMAARDVDAALAQGDALTLNEGEQLWACDNCGEHGVVPAEWEYVPGWVPDDNGNWYCTDECHDIAIEKRYG